MEHLNGQCLCGAVEFKVHTAPSKIYQCHCSLCRKQSGAGSNSAFIVRQSQLSWAPDIGPVSSYVKASGFRSDFCSRCGSPVPNVIQNSGYVWVPSGLLHNADKLEVVMHLFVGSKADWESLPHSGDRHETMPTFREVLAALQVDL